ncbi:hydrogenase [Tepidimonas aquatica]|uniref:Hydrogenase expression/formation protein n=1 Tax=Tepidimonas aquatica TaxID=247482 RepID=A0A554WLU9_9BURK|nr:hydrogenase [Tepidimonas aquatica]TSE24555.1 Hydrogenase-1 operon protein HyaE [Tepidimonas aquatica]
MTQLHPLIQRLTAEYGLPLLDPGNLNTFCDAPGDAVLFCGGDPVQHPECLDVAVVLPELLRAFPGRFRAAVVSTALESEIQARYGFNRKPTLVFLRGGAYIGALSGIQDWAVYLDRIQELLAAPPSRPPSIGIAVNALGPAVCH